MVINTLNEEARLPRALASVKGFANEVVVVDMMSTDATAEIAKKAGAKVYRHKKIGYVEPARNFAISKAKGDWIFILDADEEIPDTLKSFIKSEVKKPAADYYRIPRKNIIFGKWMKHTGWWPDYNIRFFKKGAAAWNEVIHSIPMTIGRGIDLPAEEELAIVHRNYSSVEEYLLRMNRYTSIQAKEINKSGYVFSWKDIITKPVAEFVSRFFVLEGYKDGLHGLGLSLLQAFSELALYLKLWQKQKFLKKKIGLGSLERQFGKSKREICWWLYNAKSKEEPSFIKRIYIKCLKNLLFR